jgi:hypothetical protein
MIFPSHRTLAIKFHHNKGAKIMRVMNIRLAGCHLTKSTLTTTLQPTPNEWLG